MTQINVNIRIDEDLKQEFESLCQNLGLTMTAAFNVFAKTAVRQQSIPFRVSMEPNAETKAAIEEARMMMKDPSKHRTYTDVDEMIRELLS
ncbi:MAG: type II toxin-antitoxin system RelB/DinJ family antitoxin [Methanomassiliicoccaceae archaeon]|nr:type II toxin-antitoxin system RelB/DinJ family antitoxin [Methanomassiliicoccaceae archaeon]